MNKDIPNKVTHELIESEIDSVKYEILEGSTITRCQIIMKCGFRFVGESACIDPNNFDKKLGEEYAYNDAYSQIWKPYGFHLMMLKQQNKEV